MSWVVASLVGHKALWDMRCWGWQVWGESLACSGTAFRSFVVWQFRLEMMWVFDQKETYL